MRYLILIPCLFFLTGCLETLEEQVERSTKELTSAADGINANASNAIALLKDINRDLGDKVKDLINNDIDRLIKTTEFSLGAEARCETDFLAKRIKTGLQNTIIQLQNLVRKKNNQIPQPLLKFAPSFCNCTPEQIDLNEDNTKPLKIYGYDFEDFSNIHVIASKLDGTSKDITPILAKNTDYLLTLRTNDSSYFSGYNKIEYHYNRQSIYTMLIIPKTPRICQEEDIVISPILPLLNVGSSNCGGDNEFGGNAYLDCTGTIRLSSDQRTMICHIGFRAAEKDGDTRGCWEEDYELYTAKNGYIIKSILTPTNYHFNYEDDDEEDDNFGGNGFVKSATFRGDHHGSDIGAYTGATLQLSNFTVTLIESNNECVPKDVYIGIHAAEIKLKNAMPIINKNQANIIKAINSSNQ